MIRGQKSIEGTSQPIFVVDGVPVDNSTIVTTEPTAGTQAMNRMSDLNPADIESVEILKGAAAAAIYGARAGAGVVLITTKRGQAGAPKWNYRVELLAGRGEQGLSAADAVRPGRGWRSRRAAAVPVADLTGASFGPRARAGHEDLQPLHGDVRERATRSTTP